MEFNIHPEKSKLVIRLGDHSAQVQSNASTKTFAVILRRLCDEYLKKSERSPKHTSSPKENMEEVDKEREADV